MPDYREHLAQGPFDLIVADIPWGYDQGITHAKQKELVTYPTITDPTFFMQHAFDALKPDRNLWVWSDWFTLPKLMVAADAAGFKYRALCVVKRRNLGLGYFTRKQVYYLPCWCKGKGYYNKEGWLSEYLGEHSCKRSQKPVAVYEKLVAHSLPPGGIWCDPFPTSHDEVYRKVV